MYKSKDRDSEWKTKMEKMREKDERSSELSAAWIYAQWNLNSFLC